MPGGPRQPTDEPIDQSVESVPLEDDEGNVEPIRQQNVGPAAEEGSGEWPDPATPPRGPAPG